MLRSRILPGLALVMASFALGACIEDLPTAPDTTEVVSEVPVAADTLPADTVPADTVPADTVPADTVPLPPDSAGADVVERDAPMADDEVVTRSIGPLGGIIILPGAGLTMTVPPLALDAMTEITVRAPAGGLVGYHFEPHGLEFRLPVTLVQDMTKTKSLGAQGLGVVYFDGQLEAKVTPLERLILRISGLLGIFTIEHFSGYVIATT